MTRRRAHRCRAFSSCRLCHLYGRATRTVSIVPPVYYAHLCAARGKLLAADMLDASTDTESVASSSRGGGSTAAAIGSMVGAHEKLRKTMYWI